MLKRLAFMAAALLALSGSTFAAGTIPFSLSQQLDSFAKPLSGCKFYTIRAGTTSTPQNAFQDIALTIPLPNPQTCDAAGRLPQMFLADGLIKVRLTDKNGVSIVVADNVQVIGPSGGGGGGGGGVDPTTIAATGDVKSAYGTSVLNGWVRANGRTIGNASSGASERANADTQDLFTYLWGADGTLPVSGGRGASAALDFAGGKTITLPDFRGRVLAGFDDMGNVGVGRLTTFSMTGSGIGSVSKFTAARQLNTLNLPPYAPIGTVTNGAISVVPAGSTFLPVSSGNIISNSSPGGAFGTSGSLTVSQSASTFTGADQGGTAAPFDIVQPTIFVTHYLKL